MRIVPRLSLQAFVIQDLSSAMLLQYPLANPGDSRVLFRRGAGGIYESGRSDEPRCEILRSRHELGGGYGADVVLLTEQGDSPISIQSAGTHTRRGR
jgi:hypothetical protein